MVAGLGAFDQYLLAHAGVGILPHIAQTDARLDLVDILAAGAAASERVPFDFSLVDLHVERLGLWQHCHGSSRCMDTALCFGGRHTLHAMHTAFIFQRAVDTVARDRQHYFLEASRCALARRGDGHVPAAAFTVFHIHLAEVAGKDRGFVAAGAPADFEYCVFSVLGICRNQQKLYFLFEPGHTFGGAVKLFAGHLAHLLIVFGP